MIITKSVKFILIDEMINHIMSKCSQLVQREYKTIYEWVGKVIH